VSDAGTATGRAGLEFGGVLLEALSGSPIPAARGLDLRVDGAGLTVTGPTSGVGRLVAWDELTDARCGEAATLPDGSPAVGLTAALGPRRVRWLIPADQLTPGRRDELDRLLAHQARPAPAGPPAPPGAPGGPSAPPTGPPVPPAPTGRQPERRVRWPAVALVVLVVVLVAAAGALAVTLSAPQRGAAGAPSTSAGDREVAQQINISGRDVPSTWSVDRSVSGPLGAFFSGQAGAGLSATQRRMVASVAGGFERCMGIPASADRIFGRAGATPTAQANSEVFAAPSAGPIVETGSQTQVFASASAVAADQAQVSSARFPQCFGTALGTEFVDGAQGDTGATFGTPQVQPLALPATRGVETVGIELTIPITSAAATVSTQFGFVLAGGGRVEATLITFAAAASFPAPLTASLTATLEHNIAARGTATGA